MKKLSILFLLLFLSVDVYAFNPLKWIFGGGPKVDVSKRENIKTGVTDGSKVGLNDIRFDLGEMKKMLEANMKVNADIQAKAADFSNTVHGNMTNDIKIFKYAFGFMTLLCTGLLGVITKMAFLLAQKGTNLLSQNEHLQNLKEEKRKYAAELDNYRHKGVIK